MFWRKLFKKNNIYHHPKVFLFTVFVIIGAALGAGELWLYREVARINLEVARIYSAIGRPLSALDIIKGRALPRENYVEVQRIAAAQYIRLGNIAEAEEILNKLLDTSNKDVDILYLTGLVRYHRGDFDGAIKTLGQSILLNPSSAENSYDLLGTVYLEMGNNIAAEDAFKRGLYFYPNNPALHDGLGVAYLRQGKNDLAAEEFSKALEIDPSNASALRNMRLLER